jgi:hypothetical protein
MRLLNADTLKLEDFFYGDVPPYAILSHTWGSDREEVSYRDVLDGRLDSAATRPPKLTGCCKQAKKDRYQYIWIDTCCIDKTNSVELQEAINSMFRWYRNAAICYAYLSDVPPGDLLSGAKSAFSTSRWFTRGWTLQELLAPLNLRFYNADWACIGSKGELGDLVETVTGIPTSFLLGITELQHASVAQRMSWAAKRVTKRQEDLAYCLLGIFGVSMPMIYGEGDKAFRRLQEQIMKDVGDDSILAWGLNLDAEVPNNAPGAALGAALAPAPASFANSGKIVAMDHPGHDSFEVHGGSLRLPLTLSTAAAKQTLGYLRCVHEGRNLTVGIPLVAAPGRQPHKYFRAEGGQAILVQNATHAASAPLVHIQLDGGRNSSAQAASACWFHIRNTIPNLELIDVHPEACWHKERALIEAAVDPAADGVQRILARFRDNSPTSAEADFVAVLEVDSQSNPRCNLMLAFRETFMGEMARHSDAWGARVHGVETATNSTMSLGMVLENPQVSSSQRRFILWPVVVPYTPLVTINATVELRAAGATAALQYLRRIYEEEKGQEEAMVDQTRNVKQRLALRQTELEKVQAEIETLKLEERRLVEELDREQKLESELLDARRRAKKTRWGMQGTILDMYRFIETHERREQCPEREDACIRAAEQMLAFAVEMEYDSLARGVIDHAANVDNKGSSEKTALHHAVWRGHDKLVWLLITKGADVNSPDQAGATPLHMAAERGFEDIVRLLLENGADVGAKTERGDTPLDLALRSGIKREQIAKLLSKHWEAETVEEAIRRGIDGGTGAYGSQAQIYGGRRGGAEVFRNPQKRDTEGERERERETEREREGEIGELGRGRRVRVL